MKSALIIEDSEDVCRLWYRLARKCWFFTVHTALTLDEASQWIDCCDYDLIITDINMPRGNAIELLASNADKIGDTPIIVISAAEDSIIQTAKDLLIECGLNLVQCLSKPVQPRDLLKIL